MFTGVVEVGLFCDMAEAAYFGMEVRLFIQTTARGLTDRTAPL